jgi:hypothetical protein
MRIRKIIFRYYSASAKYPVGLDKVYIRFCVIIMEASLRVPAIARPSWLAGAPIVGAQPRWSCDYSQRADTVDLISAWVDVNITSPHVPGVVHMRDTQYLLAKTGRI